MCCVSAGGDVGCGFLGIEKKVLKVESRECGA
jgi:hypothetical protein